MVSVFTLCCLICLLLLSGISARLKLDALYCAFVSMVNMGHITPAADKLNNEYLRAKALTYWAYQC